MLEINSNVLSKQLCKQLTFKDLDQKRNLAKAYISRGIMSCWNGRPCAGFQALSGAVGRQSRALGHQLSQSRAARAPTRSHRPPADSKTRNMQDRNASFRGDRQGPPGFRTRALPSTCPPSSSPCTTCKPVLPSRELPAAQFRSLWELPCQDFACLPLISSR